MGYKYLEVRYKVGKHLEHEGRRGGKKERGEGKRKVGGGREEGRGREEGKKQSRMLTNKKTTNC